MESSLPRAAKAENPPRFGFLRTPRILRSRREAEARSREPRKEEGQHEYIRGFHIKSTWRVRGTSSSSTYGRTSSTPTARRSTSTTKRTWPPSTTYETWFSCSSWCYSRSKEKEAQASSHWQGCYKTELGQFVEKITKGQPVHGRHPRTL